MSKSNFYRSLKLRYRILRQFSRKQNCLVDLCLKAELQEQRGLPLYTLASRLQKQKQSLACIWLHVTSLAISFPQCYVTFFMFQFFQFYLSALPSLPPVSLSEHRLSGFFSGPPLCYITKSIKKKRVVNC
jgi:hypothetical protein